MKNGTGTPPLGWIERRHALGKALRRARHPLTQTEVARAVGRPQSCVSVWERGGIELGVDRVYELEELYGVRHGSMLEQAGYIDRVHAVWWEVRGEPVSGWAPEGFAESLVDFQRALLEWLDQYGPVVEAAAILREDEGEPASLALLLDTKALTNLRLGWEIWAGQVEIAGEDPAQLVSRWLSPYALERCRFAVWGETSQVPNLRLVGE